MADQHSSPGGKCVREARRKSDNSLARTAVEFARQAEKLSFQKPSNEDSSNVVIEARFITPQDPVLVTSGGQRLPAVPVEEAHKLNILRRELEGDGDIVEIQEGHPTQIHITGTDGDGGKQTNVVSVATHKHAKPTQSPGDGTLEEAMPPSSTNPLFPPLPLWGPPSFLRNIQCMAFRVTSFLLSLAFLMVIVLGSLFTSILPFCSRSFRSLTFRNPNAGRPFITEELRRKRRRKELERAWKRAKLQGPPPSDVESASDDYVPTEGGPDPIVCDPGYYARRVGLDIEEFQVQTEDGFIIDLWHVYDPREHTRLAVGERGPHGPDPFTDPKKAPENPIRERRFPVLLMHGLLQSAGAYCVNDDDSLAFYLCKAGFDVWLGSNRCGFKPKHTLLDYSDPRMWCWNIRQMGVMDLPALVSRVIHETGFEKIGLICHSQGTTQTFVALAKEQRPDLGEKLSVFCALAPAAYAGPLIGKMYFKFMRVISPAIFRLMFGIHAFIPFMMTMHSILHPKLYGWLGYKVFSFLFDWSDARWDRDLRDRMFQFAPVYVSSESMRWWLGRECFARHKCILATKEIVRAEEREDEIDGNRNEKRSTGEEAEGGSVEKGPVPHKKKPRGATAWYNDQAPPFALWVAGSDDLVDGKKLLSRFEKGREPHVHLVHSKVIPEYEHLDVIWAMDAVDKVFNEVKEVLWKTCTARDACRVPSGCEDVSPWTPPTADEMMVADVDAQEQSSSGSDE